VLSYNIVCIQVHLQDHHFNVTEKIFVLVTPYAVTASFTEA